MALNRRGQAPSLQEPVERASGLERGFTYVETMVSMMVLVVGLTGLLALLGYTVATLSLAQDEIIARQKAREALESIFTARNTQQLQFSDIRNAGQGGIFLSGFQPLLRPNPQGLVGTATDGEPEVMLLPGRDDLLGTADDEVRSLERFERQIEIADLQGGTDLRLVTVTVRYQTRQGWERTFAVETCVSRFR